MSGFERSNSPERHDAPGGGERPWPDDFTLEERQFAEELHKFFSIEREELPPLYIQTLLDNDMCAPFEKNDMRRMIYKVRDAVGLPRKPLFTRQWAPSAWANQFSIKKVTGAVKRASRPVVAVVALLIFAMLGSMYLATPSFAQGLRLLFGDTGAQQVARYPSHVTPETRVTQSPSQSPAMPTFWPGMLNGNYVYQGMRILSQEQYSRGSILDLQYVLSERNAQQVGSGMLDIREFQISDSLSAVLQGVQEGSTNTTSVNGLKAVYVDGMWVSAPGQRTIWQSGTRSMLIFEREGVIFWIVGDQRDGFGEAQLVQVASQMVPTTMSALVRANHLPSVRLIGAQLSASLRDPIGYSTELYTVIPRGVSPDTVAGEFVSQGQPQQAQQAPLN